MTFRRHDPHFHSNRREKTKMAKQKLVKLSMRQRRLLEALKELRSIRDRGEPSSLRAVAKHQVSYTSLQRVSKKEATESTVLEQIFQTG